MLGNLLAREMVRIESYSLALLKSQPIACYNRIQSLTFLAKAHQLILTTLGSIPATLTSPGHLPAFTDVYDKFQVLPVCHCIWQPDGFKQGLDLIRSMCCPAGAET